MLNFPLKIVYVAGPISGSPQEKAENIKRGHSAGVEVWKLGAVALVPHLNTLGMFEEDGVPGPDIYLGDLEILERCDAMLRLPGWEKSKGTNYETAWANHKGIPIFDSIIDLGDWLARKPL